MNSKGRHETAARRRAPRILFLGYNVASQVDITVAALRAAGKSARAICPRTGIMVSGGSVEYIYDGHASVRRFSTAWFRNHAVAFTKVLWAIARSDVVHYSGGGWSLNGRVDWRWARLLRRLRCITFHGSDIRSLTIEAEDSSQYASYVEAAHASPAGSTPLGGKTTEASRAMQRTYAAFGFRCFISTETMRRHIDRVAFPDVTLIRNMIDTSEIIPQLLRPGRERPLVVHSPSSTGLKGTDAVLAAVDACRAQGLDFEFRLVHGVERKEALAILADADVFLDQFLLSGYGVVAIEAMALGKPVICYIAPSVKADMPSDLPIVNAAPQQLSQELAALLRDGDRRHQLGADGRAFAERWHDAANNVAQLVTCYRDLQRLDRGKDPQL